MKTKFAKRVFSSMLTLGVLLSLLPTAAFAEKVTSSPGNTDLEVEYFNSTLYDWDEAKANAATANADKKSSGGYKGKGFYFTDTSSGKPSIDDIPAFSKWIIQKDSDGKQAQNYVVI